MLSATKVKLDYHLCLMILLPVVLLLANQAWFFPVVGGPSDGWINDLYFYGFGKIPQLFASYKSVRLSWVVKGWIFQKLFSPITAYYLLNLFIFYACIIPFYYIVKLLFNRNVALIAGLAFATYSQFHSIMAFEWDYHTHDATANMLLTLLFLLLATRRPRWRAYLFLAGSTCASAFQSPFVALYGLSAIFWYLYLNHQSEHRRAIWHSAVWFGLGGVTMTLLYGLLNYFQGGLFLYFLPQLPSFQGWPALSGYAYRASYWESFGHMFLTNKGIIIPSLCLLLAIPTYFYVTRKKPDHPYRKSIQLCLIAFFLCVPPPTLYQMAGWPALSLPHWLLGIDQFVFLAMAALFAAFIPLKLTQTEKPAWKLMATAFILFSGVLIFGDRLLVKEIAVFGKVAHGFLPMLFGSISFFQLFQLVLLFALFGLLWKRKSLKPFASLFTSLVLLVLFFSPIAQGHKKFYVLLSGALLFSGLVFLWWKNREALPKGSSKLVIAMTFVIFPGLELLHASGKVPYFPALQVVLVALFLLLLALSFFAYREDARQSGVVVSLIVLFAVANLFSTSIPISLYAVDYHCSYLKGMYGSVMAGQKVLARFDKHFNELLWFRMREPVAHPNLACGEKQMNYLFQPKGIPLGEGGVLGAVSVTAGAGGTTFGLNQFPEGALLYKTWAELPQDKPWVKEAPAFVKAHPHTPLVDQLPLELLRTKTFAQFDNERFWLHVFPRWKWVIMDHNPKQIRIALDSFKRYGYQMVGKQTTHIVDGPVSYYITTGYVEKRSPAS